MENQLQWTWLLISPPGKSVFEGMFFYSGKVVVIALILNWCSGNYNYFLYWRENLICSLKRVKKIYKSTFFQVKNVYVERNFFTRINKKFCSHFSTSYRKNNSLFELKLVLITSYIFRVFENWNYFRPQFVLWNETATICSRCFHI